MKKRMLELGVSLFIQKCYKEENCMKKFYTKPELEVTELLAEDILTASENEVEMDGSDLFNQE